MYAELIMFLLHEMRQARKTLALGVVLLALLLVGAAEAPSSSWCTITVSTSDSLRDAVDTLPPGSIICLRPGAYEAGFEIKRDLTLRGSGSAGAVVLIAPKEADQPVLSAYSYGGPLCVRLENLTLTGAVGEDPDSARRFAHGLRIERDVHALLRNVVCGDNEGAGVYVDRDSSLVAYDCTFTANQYGAFLETRSSARFDECDLFENLLGVVLGEDCQMLMRECDVEDNTEIGVVVYTGQATLEKCSIVGNGWGVILAAASGSPPQLRMNSCTVEGSLHAGVALLTAGCYDPQASDPTPAHVSGKWNRITGPETESGNAGGATCPAYPGEPWPEGFIRE